MFRQATILGPGLLGASLMQALREHNLAQHLATWSRRPETRLKCENQPWCDAVYAQPEDAAREADLIVICSPVEHIVPLLERIAPAIPPGCLITDVGSTKSLVCRHATAATPEHAHFVGSHPMVGSEKTGLEHAHPSLFERGACFVTPIPGADEQAIEKTTRLWHSLGMNVTTASPEHHDEIVAHISHLPHFLATTLCNTLARQNPDWRHFSGAGLRDTTRVASGDPAMWKAIALHNKDEILRAIDHFEHQLQHLRACLHDERWFELTHLLESGKNYRDTLLPKPQNSQT